MTETIKDNFPIKIIDTTRSYLNRIDIKHALIAALDDHKKYIMKAASCGDTHYEISLKNLVACARDYIKREHNVTVPSYSNIKPYLVRFLDDYFAKRKGFVRDSQTNFDGYAIIMYRVDSKRDKLIFDWSNAITLDANKEG